MDRLNELAKSLYNTDLNLAHLRATLEAQGEQVNGLRDDINKLAREMEKSRVEIHERLARLEASREADRAEMRAQTAQFSAEVERAALRLERMQAQVAAQLPAPPP